MPLCGKSQELFWLRAKELSVVVVELSSMAVKAFFSENKLGGTWQTRGRMPCYLAAGFKLFCGNFFQLTAAHLSGVRAAYDRGALVAMPPGMRVHYAQYLAGLLPAGSLVLLVSYAYDQIETDGPPFSIPVDEIKILFEKHFQVELLKTEDSLGSHQGMAARGVTQLSELVVLLNRR